MLGRNLPRSAFAALLSAAFLTSQSPVAVHASGQNPALPPIVQTVLYSITAPDLKGDVSFLASDALQGRYTPSPGLEVAAEFIASQFRATGLDPGGDQDYFQIATMIDRHMPKEVSNLTVREGSQVTVIPAQAITIYDESQAARIDEAPVLVIPNRDPDAIKGIDLSGKALVVPAPPPGHAPHEQIQPAWRKARSFDKIVGQSNAAIEIVVGAPRQPQSNDKLLFPAEAQEHRVPIVAAASDQLQGWINGPAASDETRTVSLDIPAPDDHKVALRNVVGILRGSDPVLKDTSVVVSAHYDHLGTTETAGRLPVNHSSNPNDRIYTGANDDASGTASVIEVAKALAKLNPRPKRSVVFVAFFGEERGELGSEYYARHPVFPIAKTVADVNLEQLGRTDATNGRQINDATLTGYDYSDVPRFFEDAGRETGIRVYMDKESSDPYFTRSDNASLADFGIPAHTLTVAFDFPDYHGLGDRWQKIDYENMARVDRMIALGVLDIANAAKPPEWNAQNSKTLAFRDAQQKLHQQHPSGTY